MRGVYRKAGQGLSKGYTKPVAKTKFNTGAWRVKVLVGVGNGRALLWAYLRDGKTWGVAAVEEFCLGGICSTLQAEFPKRTRLRVLEDNAPSGFGTKRGQAAKDSAEISTFDFPKQSPCLNVCDHFLCSSVNRRMGARERSWPASKKETRQAFLKRLRATALSTPSANVRATIGDMRRRCSRLLAAGGRNVEEDGAGER